MIRELGTEEPRTEGESGGGAEYREVPGDKGLFHERAILCCMTGVMIADAASKALREAAVIHGRREALELAVVGVVADKRRPHLRPP
jgi:hypothetical protein